MAISRGVEIAFAGRFLPWFDHEKHIGVWGLSPL